MLFPPRRHTWTTCPAMRPTPGPLCPVTPRPPGLPRHAWRLDHPCPAPVLQDSNLECAYGVEWCGSGGPFNLSPLGEAAMEVCCTVQLAILCGLGHWRMVMVKDPVLCPFLTRFCKLTIHDKPLSATQRGTLLAIDPIQNMPFGFRPPPRCHRHMRVVPLPQFPLHTRPAPAHSGSS
jgi:hypothetical protein